MPGTRETQELGLTDLMPNQRPHTGLPVWRCYARL